MAISVDTVYQKVLAIANKEQRGYITPQEFNLFADQAQMEIFEQYFYDLSQFKRISGNSGEYSDIVSILKDKISMFEHLNYGAANITVANQYGDIVNLDTDIPDLYRLGEISVRYYVNGKVVSGTCEQLTAKEKQLRDRSELTNDTEERPVFVKMTRMGTMRIKIWPYPKTIDHPTLPDGSTISTPTIYSGVSADYTRRPKKPNWGYVVVNEKALYNDNISVDFELHASEESELVYRILALAGIAIKQPDLFRSVVSLESAKVQQEKQ